MVNKQTLSDNLKGISTLGDLEASKICGGGFQHKRSTASRYTRVFGRERKDLFHRAGDVLELRNTDDDAADPGAIGHNFHLTYRNRVGNVTGQDIIAYGAGAEPAPRGTATVDIEQFAGPLPFTVSISEGEIPPPPPPNSPIGNFIQSLSGLA